MKTRGKRILAFALTAAAAADLAFLCVSFHGVNAVKVFRCAAQVFMNLLAAAE